MFVSMGGCVCVCGQLSHACVCNTPLTSCPPSNSLKQAWPPSLVTNTATPSCLFAIRDLRNNI